MHAALRVMHWASFIVFTYVLDAGASAVTGQERIRESTVVHAMSWVFFIS